MPEGDTIWRAASRLAPVLEGRVLEGFAAPRLRGVRPRIGTTIETVEAVGKHLLVHFDDGLSLDTHMRMSGTWRVVPAGQQWPKPPHLMRCHLAVEGWDAVCFSAPVVQTYPRRVPERSPVAHLGPDLCRDDVDLDEVLARLERHGDVTIAEALLDQTIAAGIGNVYKSEVLHACGVDPFASVDDVAPDVRRRLFEVASGMLRRNLTTSRRTTVAGPAGTLAVYRRARRPCRRCGTPIRMVRPGTTRPPAGSGDVFRDPSEVDRLQIPGGGWGDRSTYWCPTCQPA